MTKRKSQIFQLSIPSLTSRELIIRGRMDVYSSYGLHATSIALELLSMGFRVRFIPLSHLKSFDETYGHIPDRLKEITEFAAPATKSHELWIVPPDTVIPGDHVTLWTMTESSTFSPGQFNNMLKAGLVLFPCEWNRRSWVFLSTNSMPAGVMESMSAVVQLGMDTKTFRYIERNRVDNSKPFIFGTAGKYSGMGGRKNVQFLVEVFQETFKDNENVELWIKCFPDCPVDDYPDARIKVFREYYEPDVLAMWLANLDMFVNVSAGEAFGLLLLQAMGVGTPVMTPIEGGIREFLMPEYCFPLQARHTTVLHPYYAGTQIEVDRCHFMSQLGDAYALRERLPAMSIASSQQANQFSWNRSALQLVRVLKKHNRV